MKRMLMLLALAGLLTACSDDTVVTEYKVEYVVRIFMHEPGHYTLFVQEPSSTEVQQKRIEMRPENITFQTDVPAKGYSWVLIGKTADGRLRKAVFHLHTISDIGGAGWHVQEGKVLRHGQTEVIE